jgi:hypothetical protein
LGRTTNSPAALLLVPLHVKGGDLGKLGITEKRCQVHVQAVALHGQVFAVFLHQLGKVLAGCLAERQRQLAALGQVQATGLRILARLVDKFLGLCARGAVRFAPNDAVNALAIDHDIDAEHAVAVGLPLKGDAVLVELVASSKLAHGRAGAPLALSLLLSPSRQRRLLPWPPWSRTARRLRRRR